MAVTAASFKSEYPFFASVADADVDLVRVRARNRLNATAWGDLLDQAHMLLMAHLLANDPKTRPTVLTKDDPKSRWSTMYLDEFKRLIEETIIGATCG